MRMNRSREKITNVPLVAEGDAIDNINIDGDEDTRRTLIPAYSH